MPPSPAAAAAAAAPRSYAGRVNEYGDDIRAEFNTYFDEAQTYLNCLAAASASAQAEVRLVLDAYQEMFQ